MLAVRGDSRRSHFEMALGVGDDFAIGQVIGGFNGDNPLADGRVLLAQIFGKLGLCAGRPDDQDWPRR